MHVQPPLVSSKKADELQLEHVYVDETTVHVKQPLLQRSHVEVAVFS